MRAQVSIAAEVIENWVIGPLLKESTSADFFLVDDLIRQSQRSSQIVPGNGPPLPFPFSLQFFSYTYFGSHVYLWQSNLNFPPTFIGRQQHSNNSFKWHFPRRILIGQYVTVHGEVVSHVNITRVDVQDGGLYECIAENRAGTAAHSARLNVYGKSRQLFLQNKYNLAARFVL